MPSGVVSPMQILSGIRGSQLSTNRELREFFARSALALDSSEPNLQLIDWPSLGGAGDGQPDGIERN